MGCCKQSALHHTNISSLTEAEAPDGVIVAFRSFGGVQQGRNLFPPLQYSAVQDTIETKNLKTCQLSFDWCTILGAILDDIDFVDLELEQSTIGSLYQPSFLAQSWFRSSECGSSERLYDLVAPTVVAREPQKCQAVIGKSVLSILVRQSWPSAIEMGW